MIYQREFYRVIAGTALDHGAPQFLIFDLGELAGAVCSASSLGYTTEPSPWVLLTRWFLSVEQRVGTLLAGRILEACCRAWLSYSTIAVRL